MNISRNISIFLIATILVFGTAISMGIPASFAQSYEDSYAKDKKASSLNKQNVNCNNIIINGVNSAGQGSGGDMINDMTNDGEDGTGQWIENGDKKESNGIDNNIVNFCKNKHNKVVVAAEQTTGSLIVKKEIFGCENMDEIGANCQPLDNGDPNWLSCDNPTIINNVFCLNLQENFFDIQVLDDQNSPVVPTFQGSQQGKTIQNLEPGTYTVNEIKHQSSEDQLGESEPDQIQCNTQQNFPEGGKLIKQDPMIDYRICFEYEDEQGEDCTTNTIAAGETKTCIVKNYISSASIELLPL